MEIIGVILLIFTLFGAYVLASSILEASTPISLGNLSMLPLTSGSKGAATAGFVTFASMAWLLTVFAAYYAFNDDKDNTAGPLILLGILSFGVGLESYRSEILKENGKPKVNWNLAVAGILIAVFGVAIKYAS